MSEQKPSQQQSGPQNQSEHNRPENTQPEVSGDKQTQKSPNHTRRIVLVVIGVVVLIVLILGVAGYFVINNLAHPRLTKQQQAVVDLAKDIDVYPDAYIAAGLPQYPGAQVVSLSKKGDTAKDSISLSIDTADSSDKIAQYFNDRLLGLGWAKNDTKVKLEGAYNMDYKKGKQDFSLIVQPSATDSAKNTILITWSETE